MLACLKKIIKTVSVYLCKTILNDFFSDWHSRGGNQTSVLKPLTRIGKQKHKLTVYFSARGL